MRQALDPNSQSVEETLSIMAEGNPLALQVLTQIIEKNATGPAILLDMDDMNIRGDQIVVGVQEACLGSIKRFCRMVYFRTPWLVDEINKHVHSHKAVTSGASDVRESER